jgi:hypothetical protein
MSMRYLKILIVGLLLAVPAVAAADARDIPGSAIWYFHVDLDQMRADGPGQGIYKWLQDEAFSEVRDETGLDVDKELDRLTAFSLKEQGPVILFEGKISQETKDKIMTFIAADGDLTPKKASGKTYFRFQGDENGEGIDYSGNIEIDMESLEEEAWVSLALKNKVLITGNEDQMKSMLANNGKISGSRGHKGALLVLSAEKTILQAGMKSSELGDGGSDWDSNILRNTEQVAFMMAAADDSLAIEAELVTSEPEMAESLASVARGLISLVAFDDSMDDEAIAMLQGTKIEAKGNILSLSLAIDPNLVIQTISD